jgi:hypothetical protein
VSTPNLAEIYADARYVKQYGPAAHPAAIERLADAVLTSFAPRGAVNTEEQPDDRLDQVPLGLPVEPGRRPVKLSAELAEARAALQREQAESSRLAGVLANTRAELDAAQLVLDEISRALSPVAELMDSLPGMVRETVLERDGALAELAEARAELERMLGAWRSKEGELEQAQADIARLGSALRGADPWRVILPDLERLAEEIAAHPGPDPSPASPAWWAGYREAIADAARLVRESSGEVPARPDYVGPTGGERPGEHWNARMLRERAEARRGAGGEVPVRAFPAITDADRRAIYAEADAARLTARNAYAAPRAVIVAALDAAIDATERILAGRRPGMVLNIEVSDPAKLLEMIEHELRIRGRTDG